MTRYFCVVVGEEGSPPYVVIESCDPDEAMGCYRQPYAEAHTTEGMLAAFPGALAAWKRDDDSLFEASGVVGFAEAVALEAWERANGKASGRGLLKPGGD